MTHAKWTTISIRLEYVETTAMNLVTRMPPAIGSPRVTMGAQEVIHGKDHTLQLQGPGLTTQRSGHPRMHSAS